MPALTRDAMQHQENRHRLREELVAKLNSFLDFDFKPGKAEQRPRVSSELIHI